jgi:D-alanyl-D-alanine carboxypeptidase
MPVKTIPLAFFLLLAVLGVKSQEMDAKRLDAYFRILDSAGRFMGGVSVLRDGRTVYSRSVGYADIESGIKSNERTRYRVGSITKVFTAAMVMKSVEAGRLSLDQTIDRWFPAIRKADRITVRHLLGHRSGIHNFTDAPSYLKWNTQARTRQQLLDTLSSQTSDFEPGSKFSYSNSGYVLLTFLLEDVWGRTYGDLLHKLILKPSRLKDTRYGGRIDPSDNGAHSYRKLLGRWVKQSETDPSIPLGAGAIVSTPSDIARFGQSLFSGRLVSKESLAQMMRLQDGVGLGLFRIPFYERIAYGHGGNIDAFQSSFGYFQDEKLSFSMISNASAIVNNDVTIAVLSAVFGKPFELPKYGEVAIDPKELQAYAGVYASPSLPMKITVTVKGERLFAQATGQAPFELTHLGDHRFMNETAGIEMSFLPEKGEMSLSQSGARFRFRRE